MMVKVMALMAIAACASPFQLEAQGRDAPSSRILQDIRYLAADARTGRGVGTAGLDSAAAYVAREMRRAGLQPAGNQGYFQEFELDPSAPAAAHAGIGRTSLRNVVGRIPGRGPLANEMIIIGAHYDHLGLGGFGSLDPDSTGIVHNGADDNASGTAALLEVARNLARRDAPGHRSILLVAFTAEELGLIGSEHFVRQLNLEKHPVYAMLNLDMVGRLRQNRLAVFGIETAREFPEILDQLNQQYGFDLKTSGDGFGRSDQSSFYAAKIPVLHFFTGTHEDYHRTTDDWEKINAPGAYRIAEFVADAAWRLATASQTLSFVNRPPPKRPMGGGYGAYLGTIPDMTETPGGVRLTGVRSGSPADRAGLKAGDILIKLGDTEIKDLYDMTDALRAHKPGDSVTLIILREGRKLSLNARLEHRGG